MISSVKHSVKGGEWQEFTVFVTLTQQMVDAQAGMLAITLPRYSTPNYLWIDDILVTECTPRLTIAAKESGSSLRLAMITTNESLVVFKHGDLESDILVDMPQPSDPSDETESEDTSEPNESDNQPTKLTFWQKLWNWIKSLFSFFKKKS